MKGGEMERAEKRRQAQAATKAEVAARVTIPIPDEWLDVMDNTWQIPKRGGGALEVGLLGTLMYTIRQMPARNIGDSEQALDLLSIFKVCTDRNVIVPQAAWDWFMSRYRECGHTVWLAPDQAHLLRYLERTVQQYPPKGEGGGL